MATIHLIDGEKGGVGKSLFSRVLVEYFQQQHLDFALFDADRSSPDIGITYEPQKYQQSHSKPQSKKDAYKADEPNKESPDWQQIYFSEDEEDVFLADELFEVALSKPVIVNLPAQVYPMVTAWLTNSGVLEMGAELGIDVCKWFLTDGSSESLNLLLQSLEQFEKRLPHIVVRNHGLNKRVSEAIKIDKSVMAAIELYETQIIDLPVLLLSKLEQNLFKSNFWTLSYASSKENKKLKILSKQRVRNFVNRAFEPLSQLKELKPLAKSKT